VPQVRKVVAGQPTDDLSLTTLIALTLGLILWIAYGLMKGDMIVLAANSVGALLTGFVLLRKIMDERESPQAQARERRRLPS
jgi:MtN3 and saliva related transmembrane protein